MFTLLNKSFIVKAPTTLTDEEASIIQERMVEVITRAFEMLEGDLTTEFPECKVEVY